MTPKPSTGDKVGDALETGAEVADAVAAESGKRSKVSFWLRIGGLLARLGGRIASK